MSLGAPELHRADHAQISAKTVADLAVKSRLLAISRDLEFVEDGGFMSYGASIPDCFAAPARM
jgi:hypothetical protein